MSTPLDLGIAVSPSAATGSQATGEQQAGTYINFGAGWLNAPTETTIQPQYTQTPTSTASATGQGSSGAAAPGGTVTSGLAGSLSTYAPWIIAGTALLAVAFLLYEHRKA
jgi:hypothetical protein